MKVPQGKANGEARDRPAPAGTRPPGTLAADPPGSEATGKIKARILILFTLVLAFVVALFLTGSYLYQSRELENGLTASVRQVEKLMEHEFQSDTGMMRAILKLIMGDQEAQAAYLSGDRGRLIKRMMAFENLRLEKRLTQLYITNPDRVVFLRVHEPGLHGDTIDRLTMLEAARTGVVSSGLELGILGALSLRVVKPWLHDGRLIGFMELGHEIAYFIEDLHESLGLDLMVLVDKQYLDPDLWRQGVAMLGHRWDWDRFPAVAVAGQTTDAMPQALTTLLEKGDPIPEHTLEAQINGKHFHIAFVPLIDAAARQVGHLVLLRDVTALRADFRNTMLSVIGLSLLIGVAAFLVFYVILGQVERNYRRQREVEQEFYKLSTEHRRVVQLEKLSAVGMMMGEIAHQINNPLVGVLNMAQLAERECLMCAKGVLHMAELADRVNDDPSPTRDLLAEIRRAGEHCRGFVQRMLEFTAISRSDRRPTDVQRLIHETISLFQQSAGGRVDVNADLPQGTVTLDVDPVLIRHALFNLLSNAEQAMSDMPGAAISVGLHPEARSEDGAAGWSIDVRDRGPGLTPDVMDRIFTPFFSTRPDGTGMGLPVVQHIAMLHDGQISADNNPEGGAHFALWLPAMSAVWLPDPANPNARTRRKARG